MKKPCEFRRAFFLAGVRLSDAKKNRHTGTLYGGFWAGRVTLGVLRSRQRLLSAVWWMLAGFLVGTGGLFLTLCFLL